MKYLAAVLAILLFASLAVAGIENTKGEINLANELTTLKSMANDYANAIATKKDKIVSLVTTFSGTLSAEDKTKLNALNTDVTTAIADLQKVRDDITTNWAKLE